MVEVRVHPETFRSGPVCALRSISKNFGNIRACRNLTLEVFPGEVIAIAGENGAGKSTLSKCLYGLYAPSAGHVEMDGERVSFASPSDGESAGIVMIPQELDLFPELSIVDNIWMGLDRPRTRFGGLDYPKMRREARAHLLKLGLDVDVGRPAKHFSAAHGKLIEIARALNARARVVIMDEPTASLTEREVENLLSVVRGLQAEGLAVIYVTHRLEEIFEVCDRVVVLRDGKLVSNQPTPEETHVSLVQKMVGRPVEELFSRHPHEIGEPILEVENLSADNAFSNISFSLRKGEILGISGLIGSGRSELAETLFGLRRRTAGRVRIEGREVDISSVKQAFEYGIGMVPEERRSMGLILPFSIKENITFSSLAKFLWGPFVNTSAEHAFAEHAASQVKVVGASLDDPVSALSGGNQQKVVVAKALARNPKIQILDEPTRGVDIGAKSEIYRIIDGLAKEGHAVLMISSELNEILAMCDRTLVMREGRLVQEFDRREFSAEKIGAASAGAGIPLHG